LGPSLEFRLPAGFAVEASAIYRRLGETYWYNVSPPFNSPGLFINRIRGNSWDFPVIGKYYFGRQRSRLTPYLGAGLGFRTVGLHSDVAVLSSSQMSNVHDESRSGLHMGTTGAAGVRFRVGGLVISPEVRYTRWGSQDLLNRKNEAGLFFSFGLSHRQLAPGVL